MDHVTKSRRSWLMSLVKSTNTSTELAVRKIIRRLGYKFQTYRKDLPGNPDIVISAKHSIIFVHGCYWHRHKGCPKATTPKTRRAFWLDKFEKNVRRDATARRRLRTLGWRVLVVWQCQLKSPERLERKLLKFLNSQ
ncbi:MAG: very short patch repair endonuclease [Pseudolabrys sp.]|nr:very short patch repair endonuclease [Pseudolabrys sp.]